MQILPKFSIQNQIILESVLLSHKSFPERS